MSLSSGSGVSGLPAVVSRDGSDGVDSADQYVDMLMVVNTKCLDVIAGQRQQLVNTTQSVSDEHVGVGSESE